MKLTSLLSRYLLKISVIKYLYLKFKFPKLSIPLRSTFLVEGKLSYKNNCGFGEGTNVIISKHSTLELGKNCYIGRYTELGPNTSIRIGDDSSIQDRSIILGEVNIGRYCILAPNVYVSSGRHIYDMYPWLTIKEQDNKISTRKTPSKVVIEDDCWLGINSVILPGVTIHKGAVIGANSVVTKDVAPYTVVAGAPAKPLKKRLEFRPPSSINYLNPKDLPYFYDGFDVSESALKAINKNKGIFALNKFTICLDATAGKSIYLVLRVTGVVKLELAYAAQKKTIHNYLSEVTFIINPDSNRFCFTTNIDDDKTYIIVEKAWIQ